MYYTHKTRNRCENLMNQNVFNNSQITSDKIYKTDIVLNKRLMFKRQIWSGKKNDGNTDSIYLIMLRAGSWINKKLKQLSIFYFR